MLTRMILSSVAYINPMRRFEASAQMTELNLMSLDVPGLARRQHGLFYTQSSEVG